MSWEVEFAKLFRERDNKKMLANLIGTVLEVDEDDGISNLKVGLMENQLILTKFWSSISFFKKGDKLLFCVSNDNQEFYCVCKLGWADGEEGVYVS